MTHLFSCLLHVLLTCLFQLRFCTCVSEGEVLLIFALSVIDISVGQWYVILWSCRFGENADVSLIKTCVGLLQFIFIDTINATVGVFIVYSDLFRSTSMLPGFLFKIHRTKEPQILTERLLLTLIYRLMSSQSIFVASSSSNLLPHSKSVTYRLPLLFVWFCNFCCCFNKSHINSQ